MAEGFLRDFAGRLENVTQPEDYADLIIDADAQQFEVILDFLKAHASGRLAIDRLLSNLTRPASGSEAQARHQGRAAIALMRLGHDQRMWQELRRGENAAACTELIHNFSEFGADPHTLIARLAVESKTSARRTLVLALGEIPVGRIPDAERRALTDQLLHDYGIGGDPSLRSAIDWLLRQVWGKASELDRIDKEWSGQGPVEGRDWYINGQGQSFSVIRGPVEFLMGSPDDEPGRWVDENQHRVRIDRTFAVAMREVTLGQYKRFLNHSPNVKRVDEMDSVRFYCRTPECPAIEVDWYDAARYCNWLSQQEGIPQSQWCYPLKIKEGMPLPADFLNRTGYRLPTEAEWEYACRAGSTLSRPDGISDSMLSKYGRFEHGTANPGRIMRSEN